MSAPYGVSFSLTDDTTFGWEAALLLPAGADFPWDDCRSEYSIRDDCGALVTAVTSGSTWPGLQNDAETGRVVCKLSNLRLKPGIYRHGLRMIHEPTGETYQLFDGNFTITEGNF